MDIDYIWTDGTHSDFVRFSVCLEHYFNEMVGGERNRKAFVPYNALDDIHDVLIFYDGKTPVACASFKERDEATAEIKRVWVEPPYRGKHIAPELLKLLEERAAGKGYRYMVLQTREACSEAVGLYETNGYHKIPNYPPYTDMELAVCYRKELHFP